MYTHHKKAIAKLKARFIDDAAFPALIVGGSVAKDRCREDSDIDVFFVASDEEYRLRQTTNSIHYQPKEICDYPGGYVDGKVINYDFLMEVCEKGSEVARSAFLGAIVVYSHIPELEETLKRITVYPTNEKKEKLESFAAQLEASRWYVGEAVRRNDKYLLTRYTSNLVLYGIRMILAHNEMLYSYQKYLLYDLRNAPLKPKDITDIVDRLIEKPSKENATAFYESIMTFTTWPLPSEGWCSRFIEDTEYNWRNLRTPIEDR